jgi:hypothetical protein
MIFATDAGRNDDNANGADVSMLRQAMIAIAPRAASNATMSNAVLGQFAGAPSRLLLPTEKEYDLTLETFRKLTSQVSTPVVARRVLAFHAALRSTADRRSIEWPSAVGAYLSNGQLNGLPEAIVAGDAALSSLNSQHQ